jgi:hypothetical protein
LFRGELLQLFGERQMSADSFLVCYGVRWEIDASNDVEVPLLEQRQDPRQLAAKKHKLDSWWGVTTDQNRYFLVVGKLVGKLGWEGEHSLQVSDAESLRIVAETNQRLSEAGLEGEPAWHYQFEPDY